MADKKRIQVYLIFNANDQNRVRTLRDQIRTELIAMDEDIHRIDVDANFSYDDITDTIALNLHIRFERNHTQFRDFINTLRQSIPANRLLVGSKISIHDCNHGDADVHPCVETVIWEKT